MFETQNIQLVAALMTEGFISNGARTDEAGYVTFSFEKSPGLLALVAAFEEHDLLVNVTKFVQAQRKVRQGIDTMRRATTAMRF